MIMLQKTSNSTNSTDGRDVMDEQKLKKGYNGYLLTDAGRQDLFVHIEPMFPDVIAHHVTHEFGVYDSLPPDATSVRVVATVSNNKVQAAIVTVNGSEVRDENSFYHITISLDKSAGAKAVGSNALIADENNWQDVDPFNIPVVPTFFPF